MRLLPCLLIAAVVTALGCTPAYAHAHARARVVHRPDLSIANVRTSTSAFSRNNDWVRITATVANRGRITAYQSSITVALSTDARRDRSDVMLRGKGMVQFRRGTSRTITTWLQLPGRMASRSWYLSVCVRTGGHVRDAHAANDCSATRIVYGAPTSTKPGSANAPAPASPTEDPDHDGVTLADGDCAPLDPSVHPGALDVPDAAHVDANCDGIDGDPNAAIFVSQNGLDSNAGTIEQPKRTVQAAIDQAATDGRHEVYVAGGTYDVGSGVELRQGVSVFGNYDATTWARPTASATTLSGNPTGALALGVGDVRLQQLRLIGSNVTAWGASAYGIRITDGSSVTLEDVAVFAGSGADGRAGAPGRTGAHGGDGDDGFHGRCGLGGIAAVSSGGSGGTLAGAALAGGGAGGSSMSDAPTSGAAGLALVGAGTGGARGTGVVSVTGVDANGRAGSDGAAGAVPDGVAARGASSATATWSAGDGSSGSRGVDGAGGGGGGGGGGEVSVDAPALWITGGSGGGGGAGGAGGQPGAGGTGGGGSFAAYVHHSTLSVLGDTTFAAGAGGRGGDGAAGGAGGLGGAGGAGGVASGACAALAGAGGQGGAGGRGSAGTHGAGGNGGASIAIALVGAQFVGAPTAVSHRDAGAGGSGLHELPMHALADDGANGPAGDIVDL